MNEAQNNKNIDYNTFNTVVLSHFGQMSIKLQNDLKSYLKKLKLPGADPDM